MAYNYRQEDYRGYYQQRNGYARSNQSNVVRNYTQTPIRKHQQTPLQRPVPTKVRRKKVDRKSVV